MTPTALEYPFPSTPLSMDESDVVSEALKAAEREFGLYTTRPSLLRVAEVFLRHCSPPQPGKDALQLMSRLLHIVLHFNDRIDPATTAREAEGVWRRLAAPNTCAQLDSAPVWGAARDVGQRLAKAMENRPSDLTTFLHLFRINLAAFVWANREGAKRPTSVEDHLLLRAETISAAAFLRIWGLLIGLSTESQIMFGLPLQTIERLSARVQALANDLRSVERDARDGQVNVVTLLDPIDAQVGFDLALALHNLSLSQLIAHCAALVAASPPDDVVRYVRFIQICTRGNNTAMTELSQRYI